MLAIVILVLLTFVCSGVQWRLTRGQPLGRAPLRWFLLSVLLGISLFVLTNVIPIVFDKPPLLPVAYAIGFFLIMYVGIALLVQLTRGISVADIGLVIGISRHTVSDHVKNIYRKFNISSRAEAALRAKNMGLV